MSTPFVIQEIIIDGVIPLFFSVLFVIIIISLAFNFLYENIIK